MELVLLGITCLLLSVLVFAIVGKLSKSKLYERYYFRMYCAAVIIPVIASFITIGIAWNNKTSDTEVLNGYVTSKSSKEVSCEHSYSCNCNKNGCSTCYEHPYDIDWNLHTNLNKDVTIDRVDRRGTKEPPRYTSAKINDSVAMKHTFTNYIKGAENSLFNESEVSVKYLNRVPDYPTKVYDYHYINRVLLDKVDNFDGLQEWNSDLAKALNTLGAKKQVNIIILFTSVDTPDYFYSVRKKWLGGKKNDVIIIVGTKNYPDIDWVKVMSWSDSELFKVELQDELYDLKKVNKSAEFINIISKNVDEKFQRKHMHDFDYLREDIVPDFKWFVLSAIVCIIVAVVANIYIRRGM